MVEAMNEQERWRIRHVYDQSPIAGKILGLKEIGGIVLEGLGEAALDGVSWISAKIVRIAEIGDSNLFEYPDYGDE